MWVGSCSLQRQADLDDPRSLAKEIYLESRRKAAGRLPDDLAIVVLRRLAEPDSLKRSAVS